MYTRETVAKQAPRLTKAGGEHSLVEKKAAKRARTRQSPDRDRFKNGKHKTQDHDGGKRKTEKWPMLRRGTGESEDRPPTQWRDFEVRGGEKPSAERRTARQTRLATKTGREWPLDEKEATIGS